MVFSSTIFLFLFLPVVLALSYVAPRRYRNWVLFFFSCVFYAWSETWYILILFIAAGIDYVAGLVMTNAFRTRGALPMLEKDGTRTRLQKAALIVSIVMNLSLLAFFKYTNFAIHNYNFAIDILGLKGLRLDTALEIIMPLGISFYTFQSMSYTFDIYLGNTRATRSLLDYMTYIIMFPQLVAGPIVRYRDVARELVERTVTREKLSYGIRRFAVGLGKKVLIANTLAVPVNRIFDIPFSELTPGLAWLGVFGFTLQIYYDFSGYSDMAIGLGSMLGFHFKENFRYPFISTSATEYFQRWHISLNTWLRDYPYRAMGGSRGGAFRVYFNIITLLVMVGLWHGASWNFIAWGWACGTLLLIQRYMIRNDITVRLWHPLKALVGFVIFMSTFTFFRSTSMTQAFVFLQGMLGFAHGDGTVYHASLYLDRKIVLCLVVGYIGALPVAPWIQERYERLRARLGSWQGVVLEGTYLGARALCVLAIVLASAMTLASESHSPFIYYRF